MSTVTSFSRNPQIARVPQTTDPKQPVDSSAINFSHSAKARNTSPNLGGHKDIHQRDVQVVKNEKALNPVHKLANDEVFQTEYEAANQKRFDPNMIVSAFAHVNREQHEAPPGPRPTISPDDAALALRQLLNELGKVDKDQLSQDVQKQLQDVKNLCNGLIESLLAKPNRQNISALNTLVPPLHLPGQSANQFGSTRTNDDVFIPMQQTTPWNEPQRHTVVVPPPTSPGPQLKKPNRLPPPDSYNYTRLDELDDLPGGIDLLDFGKSVGNAGSQKGQSEQLQSPRPKQVQQPSAPLDFPSVIFTELGAVEKMSDIAPVSVNRYISAPIQSDDTFDESSVVNSADDSKSAVNAGSPTAQVKLPQAPQPQIMQSNQTNGKVQLDLADTEIAVAVLEAVEAEEKKTGNAPKPVVRLILSRQRSQT